MGEGDNATVCTHTISVFGKEYALKCRKDAASVEKLIMRFRVQKQIHDIDGVLVDEGVLLRSGGMIDPKMTLQQKLPNEAKQLADLKDDAEEEKVKEIGKQIMKEVHARNVVHRDLSHHNIMTIPGSDPPKVWIIDWDEAQADCCDAGPKAEIPKGKHKKHQKPNLYTT